MLGIWQRITSFSQGRSQELKLGGSFGGGTREGSKAPSAAPSAAWEGSGEGRPPQLWGSGGITPENFSNLSSKSVHFNAYLRPYVVSRSVLFSIFFDTKRAKTRPNDRHENAQIYRLIALTLCTYMLQYLISAFIHLKRLSQLRFDI
jgi:hypothetical protein